MRIMLAMTVALFMVFGIIYGFRFIMKDIKSMYVHRTKPGNDERSRRQTLLAELAALDQQIANLEGLTVSSCDDATLKRATQLLAEARIIREDVEGNLRTE